MQANEHRKDKKGFPVVKIDVSAGEITTLKNAITHYPEQPGESMDKRLKVLAEEDLENKKDYDNQEIIDIKETVNKYIQDADPDDPTLPDYKTLYNELHEVWKTLNPS